MIIRIEYFVSLGKSQLSFCCHCLVAGPPLTNLSLPWIISRKKAILPTFFSNCMKDNTYSISGLTQEDRHLCFSALKAGFFHVSRNRSHNFLFFQFKTQPPTELLALRCNRQFTADQKTYTVFQLLNLIQAKDV